VQDIKNALSAATAELELEKHRHAEQRDVAEKALADIERLAGDVQVVCRFVPLPIVAPADAEHQQAPPLRARRHTHTHTHRHTHTYTHTFGGVFSIQIAEEGLFTVFSIAIETVLVAGALTAIKWLHCKGGRAGGVCGRCIFNPDCRREPSSSLARSPPLISRAEAG